MRFDQQNDKKSLEKDRLRAEQQKEDKHLVKIGSIHPRKGHKIFKVVRGELMPVEQSDYIENMAILHFINPDNTYRYSMSIKMKKGEYVSALNADNAIKRIATNN
jgi:hypothetical protein